jgi:transposase
LDVRRLVLADESGFHTSMNRLRSRAPRGERVLAPTLPPGQVVVMDNLGAHRPGRVRELIEARGAGLVYLPPYSPDLSPIEEAFSKIKNALPKGRPPTHEALLETMAGALCEVTPSEAAGWFAHRGYEVEVRYS